MNISIRGKSKIIYHIDAKKKLINKNHNKQFMIIEKNLREEKVCIQDTINPILSMKLIKNLI